MSRTLRAGTAVLLLAALAACSGGVDRGDPGDPTTPSAPVQPSTPGSAPPTSAPPTSAQPSSPAPAADVACAQQLVAAMPLARRAAQLLVVGVPADGGGGRAGDEPGGDEPGGVGAEAARALRDLGAGSVILAGRSQRGVQATQAWTSQLRALASRGGQLPVLVTVDQEGGAVQTLTGPGFSDIPPAREQGDMEPAALREAAARWGAELAAAGVDVDLAPVADVVPAGTQNAPIGRFGRGYAATPQAAAEDVAAFVRGMGDAEVATTLKHFPGLGRATGNTDDTTAVVDDVTGPADPSWAPFRAGVRVGADFVMMSSATYQLLDAGRMALFSPSVVALARSALDFDGVVMSDDVGAAQAVAGVPVGERATRFVAAGGDLVLTVQAADAPVMVDALVSAAADPTFARRVEQAATRVVAAKVRAGGVDCG